MPLFYTPKPRQFHYTPRFYDPKKEEWEQLKTKYRLENGLPIDDDEMVALSKSEETEQQNAVVTDEDLAYFQRKVHQMDKQERKERSKLKASDMFKKREMPKFHYVSRFDENGQLIDTPAESTQESATQRRIRHRFDMEDDGLKPVPAGKIMISCLAVLLLLLFIFS